jgi:hypothetical protein
LIPFLYSLILKSKDIFFLVFDKGLIEVIGPYGISTQVQSCFTMMRLQSGFIYHYLGYIYIGLSIIILYVII